MQERETGLMQPLTKEQVPDAVAAGHPVFSVGEKINLKGGRFRVRKITRKGLELRGLPGVMPQNASKP